MILGPLTAYPFLAAPFDLRSKIRAIISGMDTPAITQQVRDFYASLTDRQLLIFCLLYGFNYRGICLKESEIATLINSKQSTIKQTIKTIGHKLSQPRFRLLLSELNNYEN